jgi:hypothetical protein
MFIHKKITSRQKHAIIVCLPKSPGTPTPKDFQIMSDRLKPFLLEQLHTSQYCGVPDSTILDATSFVRDVIAYSDTTAAPLCVLSLDFQHAFDRISHQYSFQILQAYGLSPLFIDSIRSLYDGATASVQVNGQLAGPIHIKCAIRQGCPLSVVLFALCLQPLIRKLNEALPGLRIDGQRRNSLL